MSWLDVSQSLLIYCSMRVPHFSEQWKISWDVAQSGFELPLEERSLESYGVFVLFPSFTNLRVWTLDEVCSIFHSNISYMHPLSISSNCQFLLCFHCLWSTFASVSFRISSLYCLLTCKVRGRPGRITLCLSPSSQVAILKGPLSPLRTSKELIQELFPNLRGQCIVPILVTKVQFPTLLFVCLIAVGWHMNEFMEVQRLLRSWM